MGAAAMAYVLWTRFLHHSPTRPDWVDRDRFVLSAGHASMLLYSLLHLTGYDLPLDELKRFRQLGSRTPGHPEYGLTAGCRGHDRAARPGLRQRRRHGHRRAPAGRRVRPPRPRHHRPLDVRHLLRRRPPGGHRVGGGQPRGPPQAGQAGLPVRRQPHPARRADHDGLERGRHGPLRCLRLAHPARRGWQRPGRHRGGHHRGPGGRPAEHHRGAHPHRLRVAQPPGQPEGARCAAGSGGGPPDQGGLRLGPRQDVLHPGRGPGASSGRPCPRARRSPPTGTRGSTAYAAAHPELAAELRRRISGELPERLGRGPARPTPTAPTASRPATSPRTCSRCSRTPCRSCSVAPPTCRRATSRTSRAPAS